MKKFTANLISTLDAAVAFAGLANTPQIRDYLPFSLVLRADGQAIHHYRAVRFATETQYYLSYAALLAGVILLATGLLLRRVCRMKTG